MVENRRDIVALMKSPEILNDSQKEASETLDGPLLILAGAGAGKTKTIIERIGNLIKEGVSPGNILAITFTNKAANEMKERVAKFLDSSQTANLPIHSFEKPFVSTFHSLGVLIIKENSEVLGLPRHFSIYDRTDSKKAVRDSLRKNGLDPKQFEPGKILSMISKAKGDGLERADFAERESGEFLGQIVSEVWEDYEKIIAKDKALDFDDLLLKTVFILNKPDILSKYKNRWKYIHVDEYQDTNAIQYKIAKLLAGENGNICAVGDIDQNIYSWRGAKIRNILDFEKDYPEAKIIFLEENYRSTKTILNAANIVIKKNLMRKDKNLFTKNPDGEQISIVESLDENGEAHFVAEKAKGLISSGTSVENIAVLYRANFQSRAIEEAFLSEGVPYQLIGTRFFERKEVKDVVSYLKLSLNPESLSDLTRVINTPARGIGKVSLLKIVEGKEVLLPIKVREKYFSFKNLLSEIKIRTGKEKPSEIIKFIIKASGLEDALEKGGDEDEERLENIKELVSFASKYDNTPGDEGIERFLTDSALESDQDDLEKKKDGVKLMTVHSAKGLEFDTVFITGLEDGLFPHAGMREENMTAEEAEEERRLFYVALTRAKKKLFLSYSQTRTIFGRRQVNIPSEFIFDIPEELTIQEEKNEPRRKPLLNIDF